MPNPLDAIPVWTEPDPALLDELTRNGALAAVETSIANSHPRSAVEHDRLVIRAALRSLLANGLITSPPRDEWPEWVVLDPPGE